MDFFDKTGKMALGSRLRLLTTKVTEDAAKIYDLYDVEFSPKWFPVFFTLWEGGEKTITEIAEEIGHSQPSVTKIIKEMAVAGLVKDNLKSKDKRRNVAGLTEKAKVLAERIIKVQCADIDIAIDGILQEATHNLWEAIAEWEFLLEQKSLFKRVQEQKKLRESKDVRIVAYETQYQSAFKSLNEEWIATYFEMEEADYKALDNPEEYILNKGGKIFVALYDNEPLGVCALIKMDGDNYDFEMAKMAVSPKAQGKSIGWLLGNAVINAAKEMGASTLYLESNTILKPAINLYYKLGFQKITGRPTPYKRCNIQMELNFNSKK
jgi:DNA-binding MarR family transcriptional regulator/N-acetylglutamate synthase-like GNAT family acetyltransferase